MSFPRPPGSSMVRPRYGSATGQITLSGTPPNVCPNAVPPNQAMFASGVCVAQNPWVRVTPWPVFSKTQVTVSPFLSEIVAVCVFRLPTPALPPPPETVQLYGVFGSVDPPIPVSTQPIG